MLSAPRTSRAEVWPKGAFSHSRARKDCLLRVIALGQLSRSPPGSSSSSSARKNGLYGQTQFDDDVYFGTILHFVDDSPPLPGLRDGPATRASPSYSLRSRHPRAASSGPATVSPSPGSFTGIVAGAERRRSSSCCFAALAGLSAALFGGLLFALYPPAYNADHTLMLEPYLVIFCLIAIALAFPVRAEAGTGRLVAAGVSLGVAGSIKVWASFPLIALLVVFALSDIRRALRVLFGAIVGAVGVCGVFFAAAPSAFVRDIISSQLARTTAHPTPIFTRLWSIVGLNLSSASLLVQHAHTLILIVTCVVAAMLILGSILPSLLRHGSPFESFILLATALVIASLFVPQVFYAHYAYFSAPFLAIGLGIAFSRGVHARCAARRRTWRGALAPALRIGLAGGVGDRASAVGLAR